jgi:rhamnosyltransferase
LTVSGANLAVENPAIAVPARICAAIVTCRPDLAELRAVVAAAAAQVPQTLIIDNATMDEAYGRFVREELPPGVHHMRNSTNLGLGAAFNQAFEWAGERGFSHVLLLDQDSTIGPDMVSHLAQASAELSARSKVAGVGPAFIDAHTGRPAPFVRFGLVLNRKVHSVNAALVECDFLISSGSLIAVDAFRTIGPMDESLFIDSVDIEWCFRARRRGYHLFGVGVARMHHRIGDRIHAIRWLGSTVVHSPVRLYYMTRNRILLYRRPSTPAIWVSQDIPRLVFKLLRFGLLVSPRVRNIRAMWAGVVDGVRGRAGPVGRVL